MIDNSSMEEVSQHDSVAEGMDTQEGIIGMGLASTLHTVLIQSSPKIFAVLTSLYRSLFAVSS